MGGEEALASTEEAASSGRLAPASAARPAGGPQTRPAPFVLAAGSSELADGFGVAVLVLVVTLTGATAVMRRRAHLASAPDRTR